MKIDYLVFLVIGGLIACQPQIKEVSSKEAADTVSGFYGEKITGENAVSVEQMHLEMLTKGSFEGKVRSEIKEVCVNKGCWMTLSLPDGNLMRVTFKDYGFFVPTTSKGYPVIIEGRAEKSITDIATLRHYAEDAGKSQEEIDKIQENEESFNFEATGVLIPDTI